MKYSASASLAFALGASAASLRRDTCSYTLTATGGQTGKVGQLDDGQLRILGGHPDATFTINNGATTDGKGRPCYLTSESNQYQCDTGMTANGAFAIGSDGTYTHFGSSVFYACPVSDSDFNIYTTPVAGQSKCVQVGLTASGCFAPAPSSSSARASSSAPASSVASVSTPASSPPSSVKPSVITSISIQQQTCSAETKTVFVTNSAISTAPGQTVVVAQTPSAQTVYVTSTAPGQTVHETQMQEKTAPVQTVTLTQTAPASTVTVTQVHTMTAVNIEQHTATESIQVPNTPVTITQTQATTVVTPPKVPSSSSVVPSIVSKASSAASSVASKASSTASSSKSCPTNLDGAYTAPNLIVPISSASPDKAYGTSYNGVVNSTISSLFNFDIPASYASKTCSLVFLFPTQDMLETSSYTFSGTGAIDFKQLTTTVTTGSTYNSIGATTTDFGSKNITPGSWTVANTFTCPAGQAISYEMTTGGSNTNFWWFEDYNPSPIGLFITTC